MTAAKTGSVRDVIKAGTADKALRGEGERTALARAVAIRVVSYRAQQGLSQGRWRTDSGSSSPRWRAWSPGTRTRGSKHWSA